MLITSQSGRISGGVRFTGSKGQRGEVRSVASSCMFRAGARLHTERSSVRRGKRRATWVRAEGAIKEGELVSSEEEFQKKVTDRQEAVIVDWMAKWCRKCIYLKPKLEKMIKAEFPGMDLVFIDVNAIPGSLVYGHGIKKMPTITVHKGGEKVREHIAAEAAPRAISNIKAMISDYLELNPQEKELIEQR